MNTKTDEISSGLVAVVATDHPDLVGGIVWSRCELDWINNRLSDAEAIISQQAERIKELTVDIAEEEHIRDRMSQLLSETAVALKGQEETLQRHGWQDLPDIAAKQSAALKLAKESLTIARGTFAGYALHHNEKGDSVKAQANKDLADAMDESIAAIDALKGE